MRTWVVKDGLELNRYSVIFSSCGLHAVTLWIQPVISLSAHKI